VTIEPAAPPPPATGKTLLKILTARQLQSAAISQLGGPARPLVTSTAMQFPNAASAQAAYTALAALDAGANAPTGTTAAVTPATGVQGEVISYSGAGFETIAFAGNGVYTLRELQTAGSAPVSANAVTTVLTSLIGR
jgi:hypothetical protein